MNAIIFGATKGMGRALARQMAARGDSLVLLGRNERELERSAADLSVRGEALSPGKSPAATWAYCDLQAPETFAPALQSAWERLGHVHAVILTAALFGQQTELEQDPALRLRLLTANFSHSVEFLEQSRQRLLAQGGGRLVAFSSVAGDRGRSPVGLYGATKAGLSHYMESVDHRYRRQGIVSICVKPGFVRTSMTDGLPAPPFAGQPDSVAHSVLRAIDCGHPVVYAPAPWRAVMTVIRHLPRFVMRRVNF